MPNQTTAYVHRNGAAHVSSFGVNKTPVEQQAAIPDATAAPTMAQYNAVLAVLRAFGLIAT